MAPLISHQPLRILPGLDKAFDQYGRSLRHAAPGELDPDQIYFAEVGLRTGASAEESWYYADSLAVYSGNLKQVSKRDKLELFETRAADNSPDANSPRSNIRPGGIPGRFE